MREPTDFTTIYRHYHEELFKNSFRICKCETTSEEIVQEVFIKLWIKRDHLKEVEDMKSYLFTLTRNATISYLRKQNYYKGILKDFSQYQCEQSLGEDPYTEEFYESITEGVEKLAPQQKLIYTLRREHNWKREKIAAELNISPYTVKNTIKKAVRSVKKYVIKKMVA